MKTLPCFKQLFVKVYELDLSINLTVEASGYHGAINMMNNNDILGGIGGSIAQIQMADDGNT